MSDPLVPGGIDLLAEGHQEAVEVGKPFLHVVRPGQLIQNVIRREVGLPKAASGVGELADVENERTDYDVIKVIEEVGIER